jgi:hypothetical protein
MGFLGSFQGSGWRFPRGGPGLARGPGSAGVIPRFRARRVVAGLVAAPGRGEDVQKNPAAAGCMGLAEFVTRIECVTGQR